MGKAGWISLKMASYNVWLGNKAKRENIKKHSQCELVVKVWSDFIKIEAACKIIVEYEWVEHICNKKFIFMII